MLARGCRVAAAWGSRADERRRPGAGRLAVGGEQEVTVGRQDALVQEPELGAGIDAEFVGQDTACVLMCIPSATSAIEPNIRPPAISPIIIAPQSAITAQVRRSLFSWPSPRNTWLCVGVNSIEPCVITGLISSRCARR